MSKPFYKKWWVIVICAFLALMVIGILLPDAENSESVVTTTGKSKEVLYDIEVTAMDLYNAVKDNEIKAKELYEGKTIKVTGTIKTIGVDVLGEAYIALENDDNQFMTSVQCSFDSNDKLSTLSKGQKISIIGKYNGVFVHPLLKNCSIQN